MKTQENNALGERGRSLEAIVENISAESSEFKESLVDIAFCYVLQDPDVPRHVKNNMSRIRELYTVADNLGERKSLN